MTAWQWAGVIIVAPFLGLIVLILGASIYRAPRSEQWIFLRAVAVTGVVMLGLLLASGKLP